MATPHTVSAVIDAKMTAVQAARFDALVGVWLSCNLRAMGRRFNTPVMAHLSLIVQGYSRLLIISRTEGLVHRIFTGILAKSHRYTAVLLTKNGRTLGASKRIDRCKPN